MSAGSAARRRPTFDELPQERARPRGDTGPTPMRSPARTLARHALPESRLKQAMRRNMTGAGGLLLVAGVAALAAALTTWSVDDPSWSHSTDGPVRNILGPGGAVVADLVMQLIGLTAAVFLAPVVAWGWQLMIGRLPHIARGRVLAWLGGTFTGAAFMGALPPTAGWPLPTGLGGAVGDLMLQLPAAFTGNILTDTGRLACLLLFGPATLALMGYAAGFPGRPVDTADEDPLDEDDDGEESRLQAAAGAMVHWWLMTRTALARRFGLRRKPVLAYPGDDRFDDDEDDQDDERDDGRRDDVGLLADDRQRPPAERRQAGAAARIGRFMKGLVEPNDGLDDLDPPVTVRGRGVEPAFDDAGEPPFGDLDPRFDDEPPFAMDDRLAEYTQDLPADALPRTVAVEPPVVRGAHQPPLRGPAARVGGGPAPVDRASARVQAPAPPPQPGKRARGDTHQLSLLGNGYEMPPLSLLTEPKPTPGGLKISTDALEQNARLLEGVLEDFGVKGEIINVRPGPVVTLYELEPAPGIKSSRVIGLADDIARSMSAIAARVAVIPGKNAIGIELPNQRRETVYLRELVGSQDFEKSKSRLALALGKTIGGEPVIVDLARTPHMLVAGTTGSGKSVSINTMILSLVYRLKPEECRLIMIDPKMLELSVYDGIPHLLSPVVTDPRKAVVALKWTVREMEDRYKKMSKVGVRNIEGFNARVNQAAERGETIARTVQTGFDRETGEPVFETEEMDLKPLPFIVVIIDEMADLMMVAGKDIEGAVQRLAQMARAAGIHVIMATQRPSVDVITGTIKANFPTRISFQVTSKIDSRTILGEQGAEQLLGQGDMLYMAGGGRIQRVHGPFVSDQEVEDIVAHLKTQGAPDYLEAITEEDEEAAGEAGGSGETWPNGMGDGEGADLYDQAVAVVLRDKKVSTSYIQRRLGIGYNRAASIIERMEQEGVVGPANHAGKREILLEGGDERG